MHSHSFPFQAAYNRHACTCSQPWLFLYSQLPTPGRKTTNTGTDPLNALLHNDNTKALLPTVPRAHRDEKRPDRYGGEAPAHWSPPRVEDLHKGKDAGRAARPMGRSHKEAILPSAA